MEKYSHYNQMQSSNTLSAREGLLHHNTALLQAPVYTREQVQDYYGIMGFQYMGEVVIPKRIRQNGPTETVSFHLFRSDFDGPSGVLPHRTPLEFSSHNNSVLLKPDIAMMDNMPHSVTVISDEGLRQLTYLNGRTVRAALEEYSDRQNIHTRVVRPGHTVVFGKEAALSDVIGQNAPSASREQFSVNVTEQGVAITDLSANGTFVRGIGE